LERAENREKKGFKKKGEIYMEDLLELSS